MIGIKITIQQDEGMVAGWNRFNIEIKNTRYEDRAIYNKAKLLWSKENQSWTTSGSSTTPAIELALELQRKMSKIVQAYKLELTIKDKVGQDDGSL